MIYGVVNLRREATLPLEVDNSNGQWQIDREAFPEGNHAAVQLMQAKNHVVAECNRVFST
jgi:hypothetical protein